MCGSTDVATGLGLELGTGLKFGLGLRLRIVFKAVIFNRSSGELRVPRASVEGSAACQ